MMSKPTIARPLQSELTMLLLVKLYRNIFRMLHTPDLKQLCLVSKTLRKEAESILYETCSVPDGMLDLFCRTLVEHPELRRHVRVLSCTMMGHRGIIERDHDSALISQGLKSLHNLRDLTISGSLFPMVAWTISINDIDILRSATFKLKRLSCIFVYDDRLIDFLSSQPSIETFIHSWGADADSGPTTETPLKVKKLSCVPHILQTMRVTPALSHLRLEFRYLTALQEHQGARCIRQFGHNLVSLCVLRYAHPDEYFPMARIIASFASYTPNLKFLSIFDEYIDHSATGNARLHKLVASYFKDLRIMIWAPAYGSSGPITYESSSDERDASESEKGRFSVDDSDVARTDEKIRAYAASYMRSCPRLEVFSAQRWGTLRVYRRAEGGMDGLEEASVFHGMDEESWELFDDAEDVWECINNGALSRFAMRTPISASVFETARIKEYL